MKCKNCGGDMEGNGYSEGDYLRCERFNPRPDLCPEPDSGPWYCDLVDEEPSPDGDRDYRGPSCTISKRTEPDAPF